MNRLSLKRRLARHLSFLAVPILGGPLRGKWWIPFSRGKLLRHLLGTYEPEQTAFFADHVGPGAVVFDVGANLGHYSLLGAMLVGASGKVLAFEPAPDIADLLRRHVALNRMQNVVIYAAAVGSTAGMVTFNAGGGSGTGRVCAAGDIRVPLLTLDQASQEHGLAPSFLKIDVEGLAHEVLLGAQRSIRSARPLIYISLHGVAERDGCVGFLEGLGYAIEYDRHCDLIARPA